MTTSSLSMSFAVGFDEQHFTAEAALASLQDPTRARAARQETIEGLLQIESDGQPTLRIVDELLPWVQNLCFGAITTLGAGQPATVNYFTRSGRLELTIDGEHIVATDSFHAQSARYPRTALLRAMLACGDRFMAFANAIKADDVDYRANLEYVRLSQARAHKALASLT